jgi:transcriptional regulator with PAS, ATPase and Fis domain
MDVRAQESLMQIIGASPEICHLRAFIPRVAARDCSVLITGETGTGKERVAQSIHSNSARASRPWVAINCAALPDALVEGELFGYEKGAFTGAHSRFDGRFKQADGGTLFLDEIGEMSLPSQAKILRAIEQQEFYRVGARTPEKIDVRVIAATNQNLPELISAKQFRGDLYYRLNVVSIELPPLRQRRADIPLLFDGCLREHSIRSGRDIQGPTPQALEALLQYDWPGNIRELRNVVERILVDGPSVIDFGALPDWLRARISAVPDERNTLLRALVATNWNKTQAAQRLSWSRMTLYRKIKKFRLERAAH